MSKKQFISQFFKDRKAVGSVMPSSRFLVKKMLEPINFSDAQSFVELGPGNGVITEELLKHADPKAQIYCFEMNEVFCEELQKIQDPRLHVINDSAENIMQHLATYGVTAVDAVISSLPFKVIPEEVEARIMQEVKKCLKDEGVFVQYHYSMNKKKYQELFSEVKTDFAALNVPPAFVYKCKNID